MSNENARKSTTTAAYAAKSEIPPETAKSCFSAAGSHGVVVLIIYFHAQCLLVFANAVYVLGESTCNIISSVVSLYVICVSYSLSLKGQRYVMSSTAATVEDVK